MVIFWGKVITSRGPLSLQVGLCALCQIHQKNLGRGQTPLLGNDRIFTASVTTTLPYIDFNQNTISESSLTLVSVKIFIPKVKIAV